MGAPKLSAEESEALLYQPEPQHCEVHYEGGRPICKVCGHATYPAAWCQCDPRNQIEACLVAEAEEHGILLRQHEDDELEELSP